MDVVHKSLIVLRPDRHENWLSDAQCILQSEPPLAYGGHYMEKEDICLGHMLLEGARDCPIQHGTVPRPADHPQEGVDRPGFVARLVKLEYGLKGRPWHFGTQQCEQ